MANVDPIFAGTVKNKGATLATADTSMTSPNANGANICTAGASGCTIEKVTIKALGTNIATVVRFFVYDGTNYFLVDEITLAATTASAVAATQKYEACHGLRLAATYQLWVALGTTVAAGWRFMAFSGDY